MQRVDTTVVALVGPGAGERADALGSAANVRAVVPPEGSPLERAAVAWSQARRAHLPYFVHDADPLAGVAGAWAAAFDETGQRGALEVAAAEAVARWRARTVELPDYYLVVEAEDLPVTLRHFYLGLLREVAPARVVPVAGALPALLARLGQLPAGRWWPDLDRLLDGVERAVPDRLSPQEGIDAGRGPTLVP